MSLRLLVLRGELHADALLTAFELAEALPGSADALDGWLSSLAPASTNLPEPVYRWGDVLDAIAKDRPRAIVDPDLREWLTIPEAADALAVSERHIRNLIRDGTLSSAAIKCGRLWRLHRDRLFTSLTPYQEVNHGLDQDSQAQEPRDRQEGEVPLDRVEGPSRQGAPALPRLHRDAGGESEAEGVRGAARDRRPAGPGRRRGRAAAFSALLDAEDASR